VFGFGEDELGDAGAHFEFDRVVDLQEALTTALVAGVPDGGVEHTRVAHERRPGEDEADVVLGNPQPLAVTEDVATGVEREDPVVGFESVSVADSLALASDAPGRGLFEDGLDGQVDAVRLPGVRGDRVDVVGDESTGTEHTCRSTEVPITLAERSSRQTSTFGRRSRPSADLRGELDSDRPAPGRFRRPLAGFISSPNRATNDMGKTITEKIIEDHLVEGEAVPGEEIGLEIDQVLAQDTTGTMVWLQFEALEMDEVQTELAAQYCDHQTYQFDFKNTDDHRFLRSAAGTYGAYFSRPGNGICHNVHKENFAAPGKTLLGSDSHTPTPGGLGELAIGAGGLDIAVAMGGGAYYVEMPEVVNIRLEGELGEWTTAKDVILEMLRRLSVKGGVGKVFEYTGPGAESLTVPERTTITNMGTELGATSSIFGTDEKTKDWLERVGRPDDYVELKPDDDAEYADEITIDLSDLEPLIAKPSMPDNVVPVREVAGETVEQVMIGSCTNGAYEDILPAAKMLKGREINLKTEMIIAPASKQASEMLAREGWTAELMAAGVNFSEATCGACIGIGHVPGSDSVSLRTFNRNFEGRSGIEDDSVYLCSPEVATAAALKGEIIDPRDLADELGDLEDPGFEMGTGYDTHDTDIIAPDEAVDDGLVKGPNIGEVPLKDALESHLEGEVLLHMEDNITTDHIIPATSDILKYRSNVPKLSEFTLSRVDETFAQRALDADGGFLVAGENYGQGSSREHAALCPMYLGIEGVLAQSFARIHKANLFNFGLVPLTIDEDTYAKIEQGDSVEIVDDVGEGVRSGKSEFTVRVNDDWEATAQLDASERERKILAAGGKLSWTRQQHDEKAGGDAPADD
jgi:aconitate hydratase